MDSVSPTVNLISTTTNMKETKTTYWLLLIITYIALFVGSVASSLLSRFYFVSGGKSRWVSTWVQSAGFPLLLIPVYLPYFFDKSPENPIPKPFSLFTKRLLVISISIGIMVGFSNYLYAWGTSYLPVSTELLLLSTQLAFNLILSMVLVKQKLSFYNLNSVLLITLSSVLLALGSDGDKPRNTTKAQYFWGYFSILGGGLLFALYLPLIEIAYKKVHNYGMVMEMQLVMQITAQVMAAIGMVADGGFGEMVREAKHKFHRGYNAYWVLISFTIFAWQMSFMGAAGLVYLTKSLTGGVCMTALLPVGVFGGVLAFGDKFGGNKAISTILCIWGFCSYVYGEYIKSIKLEKGIKEEEMRTMNEGGHTISDVA